MHERLVAMSQRTSGFVGQAKIENKLTLKTYANLVDDLADLRLKSHVQHSVSFIQDKVRASS